MIFKCKIFLKLFLIIFLLINSTTIIFGEDAPPMLLVRFPLALVFLALTGHLYPPALAHILLHLAEILLQILKRVYSNPMS